MGWRLTQRREGGKRLTRRRGGAEGERRVALFFLHAYHSFLAAWREKKKGPIAGRG